MRRTRNENKMNSYLCSELCNGARFLKNNFIYHFLLLSHLQSHTFFSLAATSLYSKNTMFKCSCTKRTLSKCLMIRGVLSPYFSHQTSCKVVHNSSSFLYFLSLLLPYYAKYALMNITITVLLHQSNDL